MAMNIYSAYIITRPNAKRNGDTKVWLAERKIKNPMSVEIDLTKILIENISHQDSNRTTSLD